MDRYFERMSGVAERHGGTVAKFIGDAIVIVFGVPRIHEDDALRAVRTALEMRDVLEVLNEELERRWKITLATKTAINTGEILTTTTDLDSGPGSEGPTGRSGHIAVGDAMNIGARLEQASGPGEIILGESTYRLVRDAIEVERMPPLVLKGKSEAATAYRLIGARSDAEAVARRLDSPMVGRRDDLATLRRAFDRTQRDGGCRVVTIMGPAGVGKSRLVKEFHGSVGDEATWLAGHCLSYGEGVTFWPLTEMVRDVAEITERDSKEQARGKITALLAGAQDARLVASAVGEAVGLATHQGRPEETFWSIRKLFESVARERPLIAVFEDIHWAERTLLDLVENLGELVRDAPILLICTSRPDLLDTRPDWAGPKRYEASTIMLSPLPDDEAERLLRNLVEAGDLGARRMDAIVEAAGGNPLFMEQFVSMLIDEEAPSEGAPTPGEVADIALPPTIQALIAARLDRLDPNERRLLESASVVGRVFYRDILEGFSDDRSLLGARLTALIRRQLIEPSPSDIAGQEAFRFVHALVRDAAYQGIPKERRAMLHEQVADWLEGTAGERMHEFEEILAYHLEQAYRYRVELWSPDDATQALASRAAGHLGAVGNRAYARGDAHGAVKLLSRATSLVPSADERQPERRPPCAGTLRARKVRRGTAVHRHQSRDGGGGERRLPSDLEGRRGESAGKRRRSRSIAVAGSRGGRSGESDRRTEHAGRHPRRSRRGSACGGPSRRSPWVDPEGPEPVRTEGERSVCQQVLRRPSKR
jgi:class 3 adenylate cyclase